MNTSSFKSGLNRSLPVLPLYQTSERIDDLTRQPPLMTIQNTEQTLWTKEQFIRHQQNDPEIKHLIDRIQSGEGIEYYVIINILYREASPTSLLVVPNNLINMLFYNMHDHPMSGHGGKERTLKRIQERFYFPNMKNIVNAYVESCSDCLI